MSDNPESRIVIIVLEAVAGVIVGAITNSIYIGLLVFAALVILWLLFQRHTLQRVGIIEARTKRQVESKAVFAKAQSSIKFLALSGSATLKSDEAKKAFDRIGSQQEGSIKILIIDPSSDHLAARMAEEEVGSKAWDHDLSATLARIGEFQARNSRLECRRYSLSPPIWRMTIIDDSELYLQYFHGKTKGNRSPQIRIKKTDGGLFHPFAKMFNELWSASDAIR